MNKDELIKKLEEENQYLKQILISNGISFLKQKEVQRHEFTTEEKINLFLDYFKGRNDIFAYQYIKSDGQKVYSPVCENRKDLTGYCQFSKIFKCKECPNKKYIPISGSNIKTHLIGKETFGIYPMMNDDLTNLLVFDFDNEGYKDSTLEFYKVCKDYDIDPLIEISQSGSGAHVWLFFDKPIKALKARKFGSYLLTKAIESSYKINFSSFDRMFPNQDYLPINGYGNLISLPLQGEKAKEGKTIFVDEKFIPYPLSLQYSVLASIRKIKEEEIDSLNKKFKEEETIIDNKNILKGLKLKKEDFAKEIQIIENNYLCIPKAALTTKSLNFLYNLSSIPNPKFYEMERLRKSTYKTSRFLTLYDEDENYIYLPRGCKNDLIKVLNFLDVEYNVIEKQSKGKRIDICFNGKLTVAQELAIDSCLENNNGLIVAPPGFGKTVTAINLISKLKRNTLVIVPTITLLKQWQERLDKFLLINYEYKKDKFGTYQAGKKKLTNKIDIACIGSLKSEEGRKLLSQYGLVLVDEVHHIAADTYADVIKRIESKYLYGLTATIKRSDKKEKIIFKMFGNILYENANDNICKVKKTLIPEFTTFSYNYNEKTLPYSDAISLLIKDKNRNEQIVSSLKKSIEEEKNVLVLSERLEHLQLIKKSLQDQENVFLLNGENTIKENKEILNKISHAERNFVILATGKFIGEGYDNKKLNCLYLITPFKWSGTLNQYVGRLNRDAEDKNSVEVHDYIDIKIPMFEIMYHMRLSAYKKLGYTIKDNGTIYQQQIFSNKDYKKIFINDIDNTKKSIIFLINDMDSSIYDYLNVKKEFIIFLNPKYKLEHENIIKLNDYSGTANIAVIDEHIIWYGGINPFKISSTNKSIMRVDDKGLAESLIYQIVNCN